MGATNFAGPQDALAQDWMADGGDTVATLSVDGHVKVYAGRKGRLPKHFVSRQKLCLPASTSYWVNALGGRPLLCLHKDLDPGMARALEQDVLPALERIGLPGPDTPDLAVSEDATPALTLVFDREGWSLALFRRLARRGIAVITWHKGFRGEDWPEAEFRAVAAPVHGPGGTGSAEVRLAERRVRLRDGPEVRQIRRLLDTGRQVPLVTTDFGVPMERAAGALFSRWAQESFFKYMRQEFNLDGLPVHGLAELDPDARVVNPARREMDRRIGRMRSRLGTLRNRVADLLRGAPSDAAARSAERVAAEIGTLDAAREALKLQRREVPTHVRVAELGEDGMLDALPSGERLLLDVIRMIAYRAETRVMPAVAAAQGSKRRSRRPLAELFRSEADIVPEPESGILRVRILGTASNAGDAAIAGLLDEFNRTGTVFPGTGLRMVYELPEVAQTTGQEASRSLQEIRSDVRTSEVAELPAQGLRRTQPSAAGRAIQDGIRENAGGAALSVWASVDFRNGIFLLPLIRSGNQTSVNCEEDVPMGQQIDDLDREIIEHLALDGRASASDIAQRIGKATERTVRNRIAALLQSRQIVISAIPDPIIAEPGVQAEVLIDVEPGKIDEVAAALAEFDQVGYLAATTGDYGLSASIVAETNAELLDFAERHVAKSDGVRKINISLIMRLYKVFNTRTTALSRDARAHRAAN